MILDWIFNAQAIFIILLALSSVYVYARLGIHRYRQKDWERFWLDIGVIVACLYMTYWYAADLLTPLGPGYTMAMYTRPAVLFMFALFFANGLAHDGR